MPQDHFDIIIIGSGAGGGTMAHALSAAGARILILERGDFVPRRRRRTGIRKRSGSTSAIARRSAGSTSAARSSCRTRTTASAATRSSGAACSIVCAARISRRVEHADGVSPAWPIDYDTLEPFYDQRRTPVPRAWTAGRRSDRAAARAVSLRAGSSLDRDGGDRRRAAAAGTASVAVAAGPDRARASQAAASSATRAIRFPCKIHAKSEADVCCVRAGAARPNVELWTRPRAPAHHRPVRPKRRSRRSRAGRRDASRRGALFVVSCGAVNSAALLLRSATDRHPDGLANSSGLVGRRYMAHLATMMQGFHPFRKNDDRVPEDGRDQRLLSCAVPMPSIRSGRFKSQGRTHGVMAQTVVPWIPLWAYEAWVSRGVDWLVMSEDLPRDENRVTVEPDGRVRLHYRPNNVAPHEQLVDEARRMLRRLGFWMVMTHSHQSKNTTHQCGTLCFGTDPRALGARSVCAATHDVENLFVVDASFFPSSAAVNPGLTIAAQALRVADHIRDTELIRRRLPRESAIVQPCRHHRVELQRAVQFYWDVFGCPLVGVADTPPERVRTFFGVDAARAPPLQDRLDSRAGRRRARDLRVPAAAAARASALEPCRPDAYLLQRAQPPEVARLPVEQRRRVRRTARAIAARPLVFLRQGLRRQSDRADGSRAHVLRAAAGSVRSADGSSGAACTRRITRALT